ncbi:MAG: C39 family peptidase, partial [Lentisphaeria bacterium]
IRSIFMKILLNACLFLILLAFPLNANDYVDIQSFISPDNSFFKLPLSNENKQIISKAKFRWIEENTKMNSVRSTSLDYIPSSETIIELNDNIPNKIIFSFYNRGDDKELSEESFYSLADKISQTISNIIKSKPQKPERKTIKFAVTDYHKWQKNHISFELSTSFSKKHKSQGVNHPTRFEYIKLEITLRNDNSKNRLSKNSLLKNLSKNPNGDTIIKNIPMVDQGQKGYCAVASLDRILKLYNIDADQHYLAQLANSSASSGTSVNAMASSLRKAGIKLGFKLKFIQEFSIKDFEKITKKYDRIAKKNKTSEVGSLTQYNSIESIFSIMSQHPDSLSEAACSLSDFKKFRSIIKNHIDSGIPILWGLLLGIVPEEGKIPQNSGGHMRLIIGYNFQSANNEEIIFSDSWGLGHEEKRIKLKDAFPVTTAIAIVEP